MLTIVTQKKDWIPEQKSGFLQSWEWGELFAQHGGEVLRLCIDGACAQGIIRTKKYIYKEIHFSRITLTTEMYRELYAYLKKHKYTFASFDFMGEVPDMHDHHVIDESNRQPNQTMRMRLNPSQEELLQNMHKKTRYNIRLAKKKKVLIKKQKDPQVFWDLMRQTRERDEFSSGSKKHYATLLDSLIAMQYTAYIDQTPVASNICIQYGDTVTYLHGSSSYEHRSSMAPYMLQWEQILDAKKQGYTYYDFWGVAKKSTDKNNQQCFFNFCWDKGDPWSGFTRFKAGFGGQYTKVSTGKMVLLSPKASLVLLLLNFLRNIQK